MSEPSTLTLEWRQLFPLTDIDWHEAFAVGLEDLQPEMDARLRLPKEDRADIMFLAYMASDHDHITTTNTLSGFLPDLGFTVGSVILAACGRRRPRLDDGSVRALLIDQGPSDGMSHMALRLESPVDLSEAVRRIVVIQGRGSMRVDGAEPGVASTSVVGETYSALIEEDL